MTSVGIRDLKNNLSRYIRRLRTDRRIIVTDRGEAVAELRLPERAPGETSGQRYAVLILTGVVRPAIEQGNPLADWPSPDELCLAPGTVAELIAEDRGSP